MRPVPAAIQRLPRNDNGALIQSEEGAIIGGNLTNNLRFADNIGALAESNQGLQNSMSSISLEAERMGMKRNLEKTEVQYTGKEKAAMNISINGRALKQVKKGKMCFAPQVYIPEEQNRNRRIAK